MALELKDKTNNANDITTNAGVVEDSDVPGSLSGALYSALFDGSSDLLTIPDSPSLRITGDFTIEYWIKITTDTVGNPGLSKSNGTSGYTAYIQGNESAIWFGTTGGVTWGKSTNASEVPLGIWAHYAFVYNAAGATGFICENGSTVTTSNFGTILTSIPDTTGIDLKLLGNHTGVSRLCDVRLWNIARTQPEISANYQSFLTGRESGLVGNWPFQPFDRNEGGFFPLL